MKTLLLMSALVSCACLSAPEESTTVDTIAALKALGGRVDATYIVKGYYSNNDGGGGTFYWNPTDARPDNGGTIISSIVGPTGRFIRTYSDSINVHWFGAKGDGSADDTTPLVSAFSILSGSPHGLRILIPSGDYKMSAAVYLDSASNFSVSGAGRLIQVKENTKLLSFTKCTNFSIDGLRLYGLGTDYTPTTDTGGEGIYLTSCERFTIRDCWFQNFGHAAACAAVSKSFSLIGNTIEGTNEISTKIKSGDNYQFGFLIKWDGTTGSTDFSISANRITQVAQGIRIEPKCRRFSISQNSIHGIAGQHGMYINGQDISIVGNSIYGVSSTFGVGIKLQSFHNNVGGGVVDPIINAVVCGNAIDDVLSGITIEHLEGGSQSNNVIVVGNSIRNAHEKGYGVYAVDVDNLQITGNSLHGGTYGVFAGQIEAGKGCTGAIKDNCITDTQGAGVYVLTYESFSVSGNRIVRPCLAATATDPGQNALYLSATSSSKRIEANGNNLLVDTSAGVVNGLHGFSCAIWLGDNDLDGRPVTLSSASLRKQTICADLMGLHAWNPGPIKNGKPASTSFPVAGVVPGDLVMVSYDRSLQGCTVSGFVSSPGKITVILSNASGEPVTPESGTLRFWVIRPPDVPRKG